MLVTKVCAPVPQLSPDFRELRGVGASDLLYVKEDIILPHPVSFYDLIVNKVPWVPVFRGSLAQGIFSLTGESTSS